MTGVIISTCQASFRKRWLCLRYEYARELQFSRPLSRSQGIGSKERVEFI